MVTSKGEPLKGKKDEKIMINIKGILVVVTLLGLAAFGTANQLQAAMQPLIDNIEESQDASLNCFISTPMHGCVIVE